NHPRSSRTNLPTFYVTPAEHPQCRHIAHPDDFRCCLERDLAPLSPFAVAVARNLVVVAEAADAFLRPRIAMAGFDADPIEEARDLAIRHQSGQLAHERDRVVRNAWIVPAGCIKPLLHLQLRMIATLPVQDRMDGRAFPAHDDLRDCGAKNALARCSCCGRMRPGAFEVGTECHKLLPLGLAKRWRTPRDHCCDLSFNLRDRLQRLVPAALQPPGDEPIGRIDSIVLPAGMSGLIARLLQGELQLPSRRRGLARLGFDRLDRGFYSEWLQDAQHLLGDPGIDAQSADPDSAL